MWPRHAALSNTEESMNKIKIFIQANAHCNLDSLPLRFGFLYPNDRIIEIEPISNELSANRPDRFMIEAWITNPDTNEKVSGKFVLTRELKQCAHILVTAWRYDDDSEYYLSEVIRLLRKQEAITPQWLLDNHRLYLAGELRTHADLIRLLATKLSAESIGEIRSKISDLMEELKNLRAENDRLQKELDAALADGNSLQIADRAILEVVEENILHRGSHCTRLTMSDGRKWYMKTKTFDRPGAVTLKAKTLIGKKVRITSWDPIGSPGKWSSQGYFRNLYLDQV